MVGKVPKRAAQGNIGTQFGPPARVTLAETLPEFSALQWVIGLKVGWGTKLEPQELRVQGSNQTNPSQSFADKL